MYKFITIRCRCCSSVIYNLPEIEFKNLKLINLMCEDCTDHKVFVNFEMGINNLAIL
jgi:hypothetical protein